MIYCFDIDGTICTQNSAHDYSRAQPKSHIIAHINSLYKGGHRIIFMTARGRSSGKDWTRFTSSQLQEWGVHYHELIMGAKPSADLFIDDKGVNIKDWEGEKCPKTGLIAGCFDLLHAGYIKMFEDAKCQCSHLIVALHIDPTLERPNSHKRQPIQSLEDRRLILEALSSIDEVVEYSTEKDLYNLLRERRVDVRILGSDYRESSYTGSDLGIPLYIHERPPNTSASSLVDRIIKRG